MPTIFRTAAAAAAAGCAIAAFSGVPTAGADTAATEYVAVLEPLNTGVTGLRSTGKARFLIDGDELTITVTAEEVPPGITHLQHFHGFEDGRDASCAGPADDANGDGIVDLIETEAVSGKTMVPFTADPVSLEIVTDTYPTASDNETYHYQQTVSLAELQQAFAEAFSGQDLDLDGRVVYVHSVLPSMVMPDSVASLGDIPAHVTLPIACGEIEARGN
ncbi:MAG TPA: hypothetical protein VFG91_12690 [Woeseiaceae bacterium]|nr:hypothetical protein [Woeseiaceae bacterium]